MSSFLRAGRLGRTDDEATRFTASLEADRRMAWAVKRINEAHVVMLTDRGIIGVAQGAKILAALREVDFDHLDLKAEDIHTALEAAVIALVGPDVGGNLHLAKSRNDQVAAAIRMELRKNLLELSSTALELLGTVMGIAGENLETIIPAFTHTQPAQPTTYAHYLGSHYDILRRDLDRIQALYDRLNKSPLGSGAVAGTSFAISRKDTADLLGFDGLIENTMDAVGSRDFALETLCVLAILATNISRLAADLILWSGVAGLIDLPDEFAATSSIMPQKKNPDALELMRAKAGVAIGNLVSVLTIMKGLPSSYNLDLQEITPKLWDTIDELDSSLKLMARIIAGSRIRADSAQEMVDEFTTFTELANVLTRNHGIAFRTAHKIVASLTKALYESSLSVKDVSPQLIARIGRECAGLDIRMREDEIRGALDPKAFVASHSVTGGPSPNSVSKMIEERKDQLQRLREGIQEREDRLADAGRLLDSRVSALLSRVVDA